MISPDDLKNSEENLRRLRSELEVARHHKVGVAGKEAALKEAEANHRQIARAYTEQMQKAYIEQHRKQLFR